MLVALALMHGFLGLGDLGLFGALPRRFLQKEPAMPDERKPTVKVKPSKYQPTKAEMEEDVGIPVDPEDLGRIVMGDQKVEVTPPTVKIKTRIVT